MLILTLDILINQGKRSDSHKSYMIYDNHYFHYHQEAIKLHKSQYFSLSVVDCVRKKFPQVKLHYVIN